MNGPSPRKMRKSEKDSSVDELCETIQQALTDIDETQGHINQFEEQSSGETLEVENKYYKMTKLIYERRAALIKNVPNFWADAIMNLSQIAMLISEEEEECIRFIKELEVDKVDNAENGFRIKFVFSENPFFENTELVKEFRLGNDNDIEPKSTSTVIHWKENKDLSKKHNEKMLQQGKRGLDVLKTFFSWFSDNTDPAPDKIAEAIKDDLWPNALTYYLAPSDGDSEYDDSDDENGSGCSGNAILNDSDVEDDEKEEELLDLDEINEGSENTENGQ